VEAPASRVLRPGQVVTLSAQIVKVKIIDGELQDTVSVVGGANIRCTGGSDVVEIAPLEGSEALSSLTFTAIDDIDVLINYKKTINFLIEGAYDGENLRANIWFTIPTFRLNPANGTFVAERGTEEKVVLETNFGTNFDYDFLNGQMLSSSVEDSQDFTETIKLIEDIQNVKSHFDMFTPVVYKDYKINAPISGHYLSANYRAAFLRECILIPKQYKQPINIKCFKDEEKDRRIQEAYLLPIKVLKYHEKSKSLKTDTDLTNNLTFSFEPAPSNKGLTPEQSQRALDDAKITAELVPDTGAADGKNKNPYAVYRIYSDALAQAESDNVDIIITISCPDREIEDIELKASLKPQIDLKGLITQFIEYPVGSYIGSLVKLGDIDTYHRAIDDLSEVVLVGSGNPQYDPKTDAMKLRVLPQSISEFKEVQTIHHEICHKIEEMNGETFFTAGAWGERHSYFIQYLSDAAKALADIERGSASDIQTTFDSAILSFYEAYYNPDNLEYPPNLVEISSWFGVRSLSPHEVFDRYLSFSIYCRNQNLPDGVQKQIEKIAASQYFPGNIFGYWKEVGGLFDGGEWKIAWRNGNLFSITPVHPGYTFKQTSRQWLGGNRLALEIRYEVIRKSDGDEDELIALFDAGTFDQSSWVYPRVDKFSLKWSPGRTLNECILGPHMEKTVQVVRK